MVTRAAELSWTLCSEVTKDSLLEEHRITHIPSKSMPAHVAGFWMEKCMGSGYMKGIQGGENKQYEYGRDLHVHINPVLFLLLMGMLAASLVHSHSPQLRGILSLIPLPSAWVLLLAEDWENRWILAICKRRGGATFWCHLSSLTPFRIWTSLLCFPSRKRDTEKLEELQYVIALSVSSRISHVGCLWGYFLMLAQSDCCWSQFFQWSLLCEPRLAIPRPHPVGKGPLCWSGVQLQSKLDAHKVVFNDTIENREQKGMRFLSTDLCFKGYFGVRVHLSLGLLPAGGNFQVVPFWEGLNRPP